MFQADVLEKIKKTYCMLNIFFFRKSFRVWDNVEKYGRDGQATDDKVERHKRVACWITEVTDSRNI